MSRSTTGAKGARKEAQFAEILRSVSWLVEGPKPRARFGRTDYWGAVDLVGLRAWSPRLLLAQLTNATHAAEKRDEVDALLPRSVLPDGGETSVIVGAWGFRRSTGFAWRVEERRPRGWAEIGFVRSDGSLVSGAASALERIFTPSRSSYGSRRTPAKPKRERTEGEIGDVSSSATRNE